ncbi:MAG: hydrogenase 4 subunit B [Alphaproteobacteria bacterium]|nr:hydrogenase 4 subunit B [Alphaproteobacteria bacterium]
MRECIGELLAGIRCARCNRPILNLRYHGIRGPSLLTGLLFGIAILWLLGAVGLTATRQPGGGLAGWAVYAGSLAVCAFLAVAAVSFLLEENAGTPTLILPFGLPMLAAHFRLDDLAAYFLLIVDAVGGLAALYGLGYGRHDGDAVRVLPFFPVFLAGMNLVLLADDAYTFMLSWEFMSVASWLLVLSSHQKQESRRAAHIYLLMAAFGTAALIAAFGVMGGVDGGFTFAAMRAHPLSPTLATLVLGFLLVGAGSKAGVVPLHAWLPLAHPAAPSHVSALMSGVMTKVAIYAIIRVVFDLAGHIEWWWGLVVLALGAATALLGVLYAIMQEDMKTLLAYSTVENIGIIVIGLGLAIAFQAEGAKMLAGLALLAALFHAFNHALYKSLLFFGAGAVLTATGQRNLDRLGGLIHRMPHTALAFLIGCAAISALPPLNGFASEWLILQAVLSGPQLSQWSLQLAIPVVGALLVLATALASVCFVRAFGIAFLGRARSPDAAGAHEVAVSMRSAMAVIAAACVILGALPMTVLSLARPVVQSLVGVAPLPVTPLPWLWLVPDINRASSYSGLILLVGFLVTAGVVQFVRRIVSGRVRRSAPWGCGFPDTGPTAQYTASSFAQPIRRVFGTTVFHATEVVIMPEPGDTSPASFTVVMHDLVWERLYRPVGLGLAWCTVRISALQNASIREYLALMFGALVVLLIAIVVVPR